MIHIEGLTKQFPGAQRPAVDGLSLTIPEGELCVLIGSSGCGKTTTMRMINRMIEPDAGLIEVAGRNVREQDAVALRRNIGYVIQQTGLFPHFTIAENIATVPRLLGWPEPRIQARVDELLALVGLVPEQYRQRYPRELSGGQRQRVGVARALAADPPVMLMDEPFGAIDPINRASLQDEFLRILQQLKKTIVFVTHDIDEALKMGDRVAILRDGRILQVDTPDALLATPANEFVASFLGVGRSLKRLALATVGSAFEVDAPAAGAPRIAATSSLREALALLLESGAAELAVTDANGHTTGRLRFEALRALASASPAALEN
ncbi:ABC transporter ATP-binding protein [Variovorax sp. HJSM1_2]|uniref:ABC transporter ATP-binding protein n=1 Tax=Variovorax sp. HJSM1_2 TaxID=3366263 RepID=UPI003BDFF31E